MYSCPTDDIHSIYIDNELPPAYIEKYEAHLKVCERCAAKLKTLRSLKDAFKNDAESIQLSPEFMNKSFEQLQAKMRYSKNTEKAKIFQFPGEVSKWGIAVAAVIMVVILPSALSNSFKSYNNINNVASIAPVARPSNVPIANQSVVIDGNFNDNYGMTVGTALSKMQNVKQLQPVTGPDSFRPPRTRMHSRYLPASLTDVDVLRPEFESTNKISIKINVPGLDNEEDSIEIKLPVNMLPERLSE